MTGQRAVFLDVDGTYAHHGVVPAAHAAAVRAARANGHKVLLCTGRPLSMLPPRLLAAGFDGIVAAAGGYVEVGGEVHSDLRFSPELASRAVAVLTRHDAAYLLEAPDALYGPLGLDVRLTALLTHHLGPGPEHHEGPRDILDRLTMSDELSSVSFGKITVFDSRISAELLRDEIGGPTAVLPSSIPDMGDSAGEIYLANVDKAVGIAIAIEHLDIPRERTIAFGDGLNDIEMLAYAGIGVAIEGADQRVLSVADRVARGPQAEGLAAAFAELGLIGEQDAPDA